MGGERRPGACASRVRLYGRIVEPNHLQRSLDILETVGTLESFSDLQEDLKRESAAMSHEARKRLFDEWLATASEGVVFRGEDESRSALGARSDRKEPDLAEHELRGTSAGLRTSQIGGSQTKRAEGSPKCGDLLDRVPGTSS